MSNVGTLIGIRVRTQNGTILRRIMDDYRGVASRTAPRDAQIVAYVLRIVVVPVMYAFDQTGLVVTYTRGNASLFIGSIEMSVAPKCSLKYPSEFCLSNLNAIINSGACHTD